jgi:hypothetical protein
MKVLPVIICFLACSCTGSVDKNKDYTGINLNNAILDSLQLTQLQLPSKEIVKGIVPILYPPSTKEIKWYYIGHVPNGSGMLYVITSDNKQYPVHLNSIAAVSAVSSMLQTSYARFDTISNEIYSYKAAIMASGITTLKSF